ncbi:MAG: TIGR04283 family arsenosugar biosynthesis glycosyltransferase [Gammaproteobacteria bacterium]
MNKLSIIIPVLDESLFFTKQHLYLKALLNQGHEIIVVDGGSTDNSALDAKNLGCKCIKTKASRGYQLQIGANSSINQILVFLHADTLMPLTATNSISSALNNQNAYWGRFNVAFTNKKLVFKIIAWLMNRRSCLTGIVTGDQTLFIKRKTYFDCGGFADIPIMEDVEFSKRLKKHSLPICLNENVITSSRKWEKKGVTRTILLMWTIRIKYYFGSSPDKLVKQYYS